MEKLPKVDRILFMNAKTKTNLDPEDWDALRALGHKMVDDMVDYLQGLRKRALWTPMPETVHEAFSQQSPMLPIGADMVYSEFTESILSYTPGNNFPGFLGGCKEVAALLECCLKCYAVALI